MPQTDPSMLSPRGSALSQLRAAVSDHAEAIRLACVWEATAPKVGNVHPSAAFADCDFNDFCAAAAQIAPRLAGQGDGAGLPAAAGVGDRVLAAITATRTVTAANVNLGIVLLIAPLTLAADPADVARVLAELTLEDGAKVYRAIALAGPGGINPGEVAARWDVATNPPASIDLIAAMRLARTRDRIARQYAGDFADFFANVVPVVESELTTQREIGEAIVRAQLRLLAAEPDTLIQRKCGPELAHQVCRRATACLASDGSWDRSQRRGLDRWLREDGNRRNPGTTADLLAAALYWLIR